MLKIAVLGSGWLGFPLSKLLLKGDCEVEGTTTSEEKFQLFRDEGIRPILFSLSEETANHFPFSKDIDSVVIAIPPSKVKGNYAEILSSFCDQLPTTVKVVFVSTTSVYPDSLENATEEYEFQKEDFLKPTVQAEINLRKLLGKRLTIVRLAGLIGVNRHPVKFLAGKINLPNGKSPVNLIHLTDAIGLIDTIIKKEFWGENVNGCYPIHPTKEDYYAQAALFFGLQLPIFTQETNSFKIVSTLKSIEKLKFNYKKSILDFD